VNAYMAEMLAHMDVLQTMVPLVGCIASVEVGMEGRDITTTWFDELWVVWPLGAMWGCCACRKWGIGVLQWPIWLGHARERQIMTLTLPCPEAGVAVGNAVSRRGF
jgi:hypothetical protein